MNKKILLFSIILISLVANSASVEWEFTPSEFEPGKESSTETNDHTVVHYGDKIQHSYEGSTAEDYILKCKDETVSGTCPEEEVQIEVCGVTEDLNHEGELTGSTNNVWDFNEKGTRGIYGGGNGKKYGSAPKNFPCKLGKNDLTILDKNGNQIVKNPEGTGLIMREEGNNMKRHKGKYLFLELDVNKKDELKDFMLTNDLDGFTGAAKNKFDPGDIPRGSVLISETDWGGCDTPDDRGWYEAPVGGELNATTTNSISDLGIKNNNKALDNNGGGVCTLNNDGLNAGDAWDQKFDTGAENEVGRFHTACDTDKNEYDSCSPVTSTGYMPAGGIILGYEPGTTNKFFFICRPDNDSKIVATGSGGSKPYYRCDSTSKDDSPGIDEDNWRDDGLDNDWERVYECSDTINNDGDTATDYPEPGCDSASDPSEESSGNNENNNGNTGNTGSGNPQCDEKAVVGGNLTYLPSPSITIREKVAFYNSTLDTSPDTYVNDLTGCVYDEAEDYSSILSGSVETKYCYKKESMNNMGGEWETFCNKIYEPDFKEHNNTDSSGNYRILSVKYYVPIFAIPYGTKFASQEGIDSDPDSGWNNDAFAQLHNIEEAVTGPSKFTCSSNECHNYSELKRLNITDLHGYKNNNPSNYSDAWIPTNATGAWSYNTITKPKWKNPPPYVNNSKVLGYDLVEGFAGDCTAETNWEKTSTGWECSGRYDWPQQIYVPNIKNTDGNETTGFAILPNEFKEASSSKISYYGASNQYAENGPFKLTDVHATCWAGPKPSDWSTGRGTKWFAKKVTNIPYNITKPLPIYGKLDLNKGRMTCRWTYGTTNFNDPDGRIREKGDEIIKAQNRGFNKNILNSSWTISTITRKEMSQGRFTPQEWEDLVDNWNSSISANWGELNTLNCYMKNNCTS